MAFCVVTSVSSRADYALDPDYEGQYMLQATSRGYPDKYILGSTYLSVYVHVKWRKLLQCNTWLLRKFHVQVDVN